MALETSVRVEAGVPVGRGYESDGSLWLFEDINLRPLLSGWVGEENCNGCGQDQECLSTDSADGEYRSVNLCLECIVMLFALDSRRPIQERHRIMQDADLRALGLSS